MAKSILKIGEGMRPMSDAERVIAEKQFERAIKGNIIMDMYCAKLGYDPDIGQNEARYIKAKAKFVKTGMGGKKGNTPYDVYYAKIANKWCAINEVHGRGVFGHKFVKITDEEIEELEAILNS